MAIEFFYGDTGLLINEIAPRTHNSAHFSIEACSSSQFDQHICISSGIKPPEINMDFQGSLMINLLGLKKRYPLSIEKRIELLSEIKGSNLHWYGKSKESVGRKMAHITLLLNEKNQLKRVEKAKEIFGGQENVNIATKALNIKLIIALLSTSVVFFATEAIPMPAVALLIGLVQLFFGITEPNKIAYTYSHDAVWFIAGSLALGSTLVKYGLDKRVGMLVINLAGTKTKNNVI